MVSGRHYDENAVFIAEPVNHAGPRRHDRVKWGCWIPKRDVNNRDTRRSSRLSRAAIKQFAKGPPHQIRDEHISWKLLHPIDSVVSRGQYRADKYWASCWSVRCGAITPHSNGRHPRAMSKLLHGGLTS